MKNKPLIYIIEDSIIVQNLIQFSIKKEIDCNFMSFSTSNIALNQIDIIKPDLIILDYYLDSEDKSSITGLEVLKILNLKGLLIPTIVFSGQNKKEIAINLIKNGAVDYISKNSEEFLSDLVQSVQKTLNFIKNSETNKILSLNQRHLITHIMLILIIVLLILFFALFIQ